MPLAEIASEIATACEKASRDPASVTLVAVSKLQPESRVAAVLEAGHRVFGENRVQEAARRWAGSPDGPGFLERYRDVELHLVGPLQTNKARQAMTLVRAIHSLDRPRLAAALARLAQELGSCPDLFVQVNTGEEPQKAGVTPGEADAFVAECRGLDLPVKGLMCIPPVDEESSLHFALLAKIAERNGLGALSMGMSADYGKAIAFGATHIRVGSALFGSRDA